MMEDKNEERRKNELMEKITLFTKLMAELSEEVVSIYNEGKEDIYHEIIIRMIESLDAAQTTVRKAYNMSLNRDIPEN